MSDRVLRIISRLVSAIFNPFYLVFIVFVLLFTWTYLVILPLFYKIFVLSLVFSFTILIPMVSIFVYGKLMKHPKGYLSAKENRLIPYALTLLSYFFGYLLMQKMMVPYYMTVILLAGLVCMLVCALVNIYWKISEHMTAVGAATAGLVSYGMLFECNVVWGLCFMIILSGLLGTARMILNEHTLKQILAGYLNGFVCTMFVIHYI